VSRHESASGSAFSFVGMQRLCSSISWTAMWMAIRQSGRIPWPLMLLFASAARTASLSLCSFSLHALNSVVQVRSARLTVCISLKLMGLALCRCGTVGRNCWAGVCMLDRVYPGLRK